MGRNKGSLKEKNVKKMKKHDALKRRIKTGVSKGTPQKKYKKAQGRLNNILMAVDFGLKMFS